MDQQPPIPLVALRAVTIGGKSKPELLAELARAGVELNEAARVLFASDEFTTSPEVQTLVTVELAVHQLGFERGATLSALFERVVEAGLRLAPLELGPHLRLQYLDQPEGHLGHTETQHRTPPGAVVVASAPLSEDAEFPKGFYLRRIAGTLWLRGYWCDSLHVTSPDDRFVYFES